MKQIKIDLSFALLALCLALCLAGCLASCLDEKLVGTTTGNPSLVSDEKDMYLKVNVPYTYANGEVPNRENVIETLDVLVFAPGPDNGSGETYYVRAACEGVATDTGDNFQVVMPIGTNLKVHIFANCRGELVEKGFYSSKGLGMNAVLAKLVIAADVNLPLKVGEESKLAPLPMHGFLSGVTIVKDEVNKTIPVEVLRSVASVKVMTNATTADESKPTPGELANFELRSVRAYYQAASGRVAPTYPKETEETEEPSETTTVTLPSLPPTNFSVKPITDPVKITSSEKVQQLDALYLFENKPWSDYGLDQPTLEPLQPAATTRLVVGGVYDKATQADGTTPKESYYRVDIVDKAGKLAPILRNHQYILNIHSVTGPGYDTPEEAAAVASVNITIQVIEWEDEQTNVDFDRENYFKTSTKQIDLARNEKSTRVITVESDVPTENWSWKFGETTNGGIDEFTKELTLSNDRFEVVRAAIGEEAPNKVTLTFTAKKAFATLAAGETHTNTLLLKVNNLTVHFNLRQLDKSLDDWGNGGEGSNNVGGRDEEGEINEATKDPWGDGNGATGSEDEKTQID